MTVRVRIAPSPTGDPHVGTAYIGLFNLIFARHFKGQFILRIEDTDQSRSRPEYERNIFEALKWCGIHWDEGPDVGGPYGPYRQSERTEIYRKHAYELVEKGMAYKCFTTPEELAALRQLAGTQGNRVDYTRRDRTLTPEEVKKNEAAGKPYVIRLKVPLKGEVSFVDAIKGPVSFPCEDVDDQVLLKSDGFPTYHLANVVDDRLMKITHVIRGDEWISSTPKHILLYQAFGWEPPQFYHLPLLLGKDGKKLSKRKNPTSIFYFRDSGYLSEALVNFLTLMGYSRSDGKEDYSLEDMIQTFDPKRFNKSGAFFDIQKLNWLNQKKLKDSVPMDQLWKRIQEWSFNEEFIQSLMPFLHTRLRTFADFIQLCDFFFINELKLTQEMLVPKNASPELVACMLQAAIWGLDEKADWSGESLEKTLHEIAIAFNVDFKKIVLPPFFAAIMGKMQGPPLFQSVTLLKKDRVRVRFMQAIELLGGISGKQTATLNKGWEKRDCKHFAEVALGAAPAPPLGKPG
jgi:glutamyl-tRNA synthetase